MWFFKKKNDDSATLEKKIRELVRQLKSVDSEISKFNEKYPLIGSMGIALGMGTPPPEFIEKIEEINRLEQRRSEIQKQLEEEKKKQAQ